MKDHQRCFVGVRRDALRALASCAEASERFAGWSVSGVPSAVRTRGAAAERPGPAGARGLRGLLRLLGCGTLTWFSLDPEVHGDGAGPVEWPRTSSQRAVRLHWRWDT